MQGYEQQSDDKISDAIKLGVVFHHLPDASLRERLLLNSRVYDTCALMAAEIRIVAMARTTWSGSDATASEHTREGCCLSCVREERTLCERLLVSKPTTGVGKARKARQAKGKPQHSRMVTSRRKVLATTAMRLVISRVNVRRRKSQTLRAPVVVCIA